MVAGGIDLFACMLGAGIVEPGICSVTAGTWGIAAALSTKIANPRQLTQVCRFHPMLAPCAIVSAPTSCVNLEWFLKNVCPGIGYDEANAIALSYAPSYVRTIYLPYIYHDMTRPQAMGSFQDLSPNDSWRSMIRAVYEGVCFSHRLQFQRMQSAGIRAEKIRFSGGATQSDAWCRLMCDILGVPIEIPAERQAGLLGAAIMAASGAGFYADIKEACSAMSAVERCFEPQHDAAYDEKYRKFLKWVGETN